MGRNDMWAGGKGRLGVMRTMCLRGRVPGAVKEERLRLKTWETLQRQELPSGGGEASGQSRRGKGAQKPFVTCLMLCHFVPPTGCSAFSNSFSTLTTPPSSSDVWEGLCLIDYLLHLPHCHLVSHKLVTCSDFCMSTSCVAFHPRVCS